MSISDQRKRLAKLEKRERRFQHEPTGMQIARYMGFCMGCAADGQGSQRDRDEGRRIAITIARNVAAGRGTGEMSPKLSDVLVRVLGGALVEPSN